MTASQGLTERKERRAWPTLAEHQAVLKKYLDDGYTDKVTHCHIKQYLLEVLGPQILASRSYSFPLSLTLCELTHFRQIRFTFGDKVADKILAETAGIIKAKVRSSDLIVRFGDQSFAILLLHANRLGAQIVAKRLRDLIARHAFAGQESNLVLTANFGAAEQLPHYDDSGANLIAEAERALDKANHTGDGSVIVSGINL